MNSPRPINAALGPFMGRAALRATLNNLLDAHRLVSIIGPPGVGTRALARVVAVERGQAWGLDATDPGTLADALATIPEGALALVAGWTGAAAAHDALMVWLDGDGRRRALLSGCVGAGRNDAGAAQVSVPPLTDLDAKAFLIQQAGTRGIALDPDAVTDTLGADGFALLSGLPGAITLAAGRLEVMDLAELARQLHADPFTLLSTSRQDGTHRYADHLDAQWAQCSESEQALLGTCAAFAGGFSVDLLSAVHGSPVSEDLQHLYARSWLSPCMSSTGSGQGRIQLLPLLARYVVERVGSTVMDGRHAAHYSVVLHAVKDRLATLYQPKTRRWFETDCSNIYAALKHALNVPSGPHPEGAALLIHALAEPGAGDAFDTALDAVLALRPADSLLLATRGERARKAGRAQAAERDLEAALAAARRAGDRAAEGHAAAILGIIRHEQGQLDAAKAMHELALEVARAQGDTRAEGRALGSLAILHHEQGHLDDAQVHYEWALTLVREAGDPRSEGIFLSNLGDLHHESGRHRQARRMYQRSLQCLTVVGDPRVEAVVLGNLGAVLQEEGRLGEARARRADAVARLQALGDRRLEAVFLGYEGAAWHEERASDEAIDRYDLALEVLDRGETGDARHSGLFHAYRGVWLAERGREAEAEADFERAGVLLSALSEGHLARALALHRLHLTAETDAVAAAVHEAKACGAADASDEVRFAMRLLIRRVPGTQERSPSEGAKSMIVAVASKSFQAPDGAVVDLSRRHTLRRVLERLATERTLRPGAGLAVEDLLQAGWPGERVQPEAGANRVYVALATLRKLGLREVLLSQEDGYLLDPETPLVRRETAMTPAAATD